MELERLKPPYRMPDNRKYSKQLFYEPWSELQYELRKFIPPFTLYTDKEGFINFGKEYVNDADPSGYTTTVRLLGDFSYWDHLNKARWFREALEQWNRELDAKLYSDGLRKIRELAEGDDAKALQAAKFLANKEFKRDGAPKRGRPSKDEIAGNLAAETAEEKQLAEDAARIKLVVGTNGN